VTPSRDGEAESLTSEPAGALPDLSAAIAGLWDVELDETEMALRFEP
jgi:hypothetical protein